VQEADPIVCLSTPFQIFDLLPQPAPLATLASSGASLANSGPSTTALEAQIAALQAELAQAKATNEKMWAGIVDGALQPNGSAAVGGEGVAIQAAPSAGVAALALGAPTKKAPVGAKKRRR